MLNPYEHEDAESLAANVEDIVPRLVDLKARAREAGVCTVYVNDAGGTAGEDFESSRDDLVETALRGRRPDLVEPLVPDERDLFVAKIRHSVFYGTPLEFLLGELGIRRLVLTGQVTEQCILYSALDAYIRRLHVAVVVDGVAHIDPELGQAALRMMERNMDAELVRCAACDFSGDGA
jgi:nicotinamidase-related amidase